MPKRLLFSAVLVLAIVFLWAGTAPSDQRGGLPRVSDAISDLGMMVADLVGDVREVEANVADLTDLLCNGDIEGCERECRCFTRPELQELEPVLCERIAIPIADDPYVAEQVLVNVGRAGYAVNATLNQNNPRGLCIVPDVGAVDISFAEAKACQRIIEEELGPCGPFTVPRDDLN